jgi:hypothetical protein
MHFSQIITYWSRLFQPNHNVTGIYLQNRTTGEPREVGGVFQQSNERVKIGAIRMSWTAAPIASGNLISAQNDVTARFRVGGGVIAFH